MKTILSHGRKDQIKIKPGIDEYSQAYFEVLAKRLTESYVFNIKTAGNKLSFVGSAFRFAWNGWDLFNTITSGEIEFISENDKPFISHKIVFTEAFIISLIFSLIPVFIINSLPKWSLGVFIIIWLFYFTVYLISVYRFNGFITDTLITLNKKYDSNVHVDATIYNSVG